MPSLHFAFNYLSAPAAALLAAAGLVTIAFLSSAELLGALLRNTLLGVALLLAMDAALTSYHQWRLPPLSSQKLQKKRFALITGGSSGIGREMAFQLAEKGYSLVLVARTQSALNKTQSEILALHDGAVEVLTLSVDLSTTEGIQSIVRYIDDQKLEVDILINNAGASWTSDFLALSDRQVEELLTLNVLAMAKLSRAVVPQMVARGCGRVLNVASMSAAISIPTAALYGSSKAFVLNLSQAMDYELRGSGVAVTGACPGPVHTNFGSSAHCDGSIYLNTPGLALDVKECARRSLAAMFRGDTVCYDTLVARWGAALFRTLLPTRLGLLVAAVSMNEPKRALAMLQRR